MDPNPRIAFTTLGCKVNQSETDLYERQFASAGYTCVAFEETADVYVINTCTVTHVADKKSRQLINRARRTNPEALVVATGCYAGIVGQALADDRTLVVRSRDKDRLVALVQGSIKRDVSELPYFADAEKYLNTPPAHERSRAMVKVQDGCDSHCTYCIIPRARGRSRSVPLHAVVQRVNALVAEGHREVVITGVDLGSYGEDDPEAPDLGGLLRTVLDRTQVPRIRVSSLEPGDFKEEWLALWETGRLCRHLHVPLQAGSASTLARMQRTYAPDDYEAMVGACRQTIPNLTVTTDIIAGFPGETETEFEDTLAFVRRIAFDGMHVFKYSKRSGTPAARYPDQVDERVKSERTQVLRDEASRGIERLLARHVGVFADVVWEGSSGDLRRGLTDTNVRVYAGDDADSRHYDQRRVRLGGPFRDGLWCEGRSMPEIPLMPRDAVLQQHGLV